MRGLELALTVEQHVERKNREAQTIAKLLYEKAARYHDNIAVQRITQIDVNHIRQGDSANHRPKPFLHTVAAHQNTADDTTQQQAYQSHRAIGKTIFLRRQAQSALRIRTKDEGLGHRIQECFRETIEQQEEHHADGFPHPELHEEGAEHVLQFVRHFAHRSIRLHILLRARHKPAVIEPQSDEDTSQSVEDKRPRETYLVAEHHLEHTSQHHQETIHKDDG